MDRAVNHPNIHMSDSELAETKKAARIIALKNVMWLLIYLIFL